MATGRVPTTANSPLTTKGDLFGYSTAPARLAVGNNGETIVADSSTATGLRYQGSQAAGKNVLINGAFDIWQRGTSFTTGTLASPFFIADRWQSTRSAAVSGATISRQSSGAPTGFQYYVRMQRDSGNTSTNAINIGQCIETSMSIPYASQTITLSFYARAGANYVSSANNLNVAMFTGTGTDQNNFSAAYTGVAQVLNSTASVTTSWQRFSFTVTLASTVTEFEPLIYTQHSGTAGAADYVDITGVQIELGSVATAFTRAGGTIQGELAACQRYYYRAATPDQAYGVFGWGMGQDATASQIIVKMPQTMRILPSSIGYSTVRIADTTNGLACTAVTINANQSTRDIVHLTATVASGSTQYRPMLFGGNNSTSAYVEFNAEL